VSAGAVPSSAPSHPPHPRRFCNRRQKEKRMTPNVLGPNGEMLALYQHQQHADYAAMQHVYQV